MEKVKVRFLRNDKEIKKGDIVLMEKLAAEMYLKEGDNLIEVIDEELEDRKKQIKVLKVKNLLEKAPKLNEDELYSIGHEMEDIKSAKNEIAKEKRERSFDIKYFLELTKDKKFSEASEEIVKHILKKEKIYTTKDDKNSEVWIYRDGIYVPAGRSEIKILMRNMLGKFYSNWHYNQVISKIEPDTSVDSNEFFGNNYKNEVPVLNGILNIKTRQLTPFTPNKIFFNKMPVRYNAKSVCPKIDLFLTEVLPYDNDKEVFYEIGGFSLLKEYTFEKAFMFVGGGRNGKGKAIELLKRTLGSQNCSSVPLSSLTSDNFQISELFGKSLNLAGDISNTDLKDTGLFKSLTGRDLINAKRKFLRDISFENYAKFVFACNELPMVYDLSKGFWDRWILLDFPFTFEDKETFDRIKGNNIKLRDEEIISKITTPEELSGLLNKFLDGLDRLLKNKRFSSTKGTEEVKNMWIRKSNSFMAFCMDHLEESYDSRISKKELRKKYSEYCKLHKVISKPDFTIKRNLQDLFGVSEVRSNEGDLYFWEGLKWK